MRGFTLRQIFCLLCLLLLLLSLSLSVSASASASVSVSVSVLSLVLFLLQDQGFFEKCFRHKPHWYVDLRTSSLHYLAGHLRRARRHTGPEWLDRVSVTPPSTTPCVIIWALTRKSLAPPCQVKPSSCCCPGHTHQARKRLRKVISAHSLPTNTRERWTQIESQKLITGHTASVKPGSHLWSKNKHKRKRKRKDVHTEKFVKQAQTQTQEKGKRL